MRDSVMWVLLVMLVGSAIGVVSVRHQHRIGYAKLYVEQHKTDALNNEWSQLLIEEHTYGARHFIEKYAREQLSMRLPEGSEIMRITALDTGKKR